MHGVNSAARSKLVVAIPTKNSGKVIVPTIKSILSQVREHRFTVDLLIIDGGSTDNTLDLCAQFSARIIQNKAGDVVSAKLLAIQTVDADYLMFLDHDERLLSALTFRLISETLSDYPNLKMILLGGYDVKSIGSAANLFASEFGDPYSRIVYRNSAMADRRSRHLQKGLNVLSVSDDATIFSTLGQKRPLILEAAALGTTIDVGTFRQMVGKHGVRALAVPLAFLGDDKFALLTQCPVQHESAPSWSTIRAKIRWRIANAVDPNSHLHETSGLHGHSITAKAHRIRTLLFLVYVVTVVPVVIDYSVMAIRRRRPGLVAGAHLPFYTLMQIAIRYVSLRCFRMRYQADYVGRKVS